MNNGFFFELTPDRVLDAVETSGLKCTGRCMALNSFENRVYDVELDEESGTQVDHFSKCRRIVKFYRPGRWTREQILEEHEFLKDLEDAEVPVIAPLAFPDGQTLHLTSQSGIYYALFPKVGGRAPDELSDEKLIRIGRLLGRIHNVGASKKAIHRLPLNFQTYGFQNLEYLLGGGWVPLEFQKRYQTVCEAIFKAAEVHLKESEYIRVHGDCHLGNLLWNQWGPFFLDFDDMVRGPTVQDIWLIVPGRDVESQRQIQVLLEGYREFRSFDSSNLKWIEILRALRFVHYTAWIARRWDDPAFPQAFSHFGTHQYWSKEVEDLEEQFRLIQSSY